VTSKPLDQLIKVEGKFAELVVATEGAAILTWAVEGAMLDYADAGGLIFSTLKQTMVEAAKAYTKENSLYWQWIEARMRTGDDADVDFVEAFDSFRDYVNVSTKERCRDRRRDFKAALKAMLPQLVFANRTSGPHKNRLFIKGLGFTKFDATDAGNVVDITEALKIKTDMANVEEKK